MTDIGNQHIEGRTFYLEAIIFEVAGDKNNGNTIKYFPFVEVNLYMKKEDLKKYLILTEWFF